MKLDAMVVGRAQQLGLTMAEVAQRAGFSRSNLYCLVQGKTRDPSVYTLARLAQALEIAPIVLFRHYIELQTKEPALGATTVVRSRTLKGDAVAFTADVTVPDHSLMAPGEAFTKTWAVQNIGKQPWVGRRLVRVDDEIVISRRVGGKLVPLLESHLATPAAAVDVPRTSPGAACQVSIPFVAPAENCSVASLWRMQRDDGRWAFPPEFFLQCIVTVVGQ
jgi:transcriptional regulator with XRE-family HTH domain